MERDPVEIVVAFLNTVDVEDESDMLDNPARWRDWVRTTLALDDDTDRDGARSLRTRLRALASGEEVPPAPNVPASIELGPNGVRLASDTVVGTIAAAVTQLTYEGRWNRVKICPADDCRWAFYDASRNQSRQWCSMRVCGNRAKVRKHRDRIG